MTYANQNALNALARQVNAELKKLDKATKSMKPDELIEVMAPYRAQAKLLGFRPVHLLREVGILNGKFEG